jgi:hypothetical protein
MPYGAQQKFGIARQTSVGSGNAITAAGSFHHIPMVSHDVGYEKEEVISENLIGRFEQGAAFDGLANVRGTIEFEPLPKALGALLMAVVGRAQTVAVSGSLNTLGFLPRTADFSALFCNEPISIYNQLTDATSGEHFFDCQLGSIEFTFSQGALARARATVVGGNRVATGIGSFALPLDTGEAGQGWLWDVSSISFGGAAIQNLSEITVSLDEGIGPIYTLNGTLTPYKYTREQFRQVRVTGTMIFDSRSLFNDFIAGTQRQLIITSRNTRTAIQSGYYPTFVLDVPQLKLTSVKPAVSGPGEVSVPFEGRGVIDPSSAYVWKATLTNTYFITAASGSSPY